MLLYKRVFVGDLERAVLVRRGRFVEILGPGSHIVPGWTPATRIESYFVTEPEFKTEWTAYLVKHRPEVIEAHFTLLETTGRQIALVFLDGKLERVIAPGRRVLYWNALREVFVEVIAIDERPEVDKDHILALTKLGPDSQAVFASVEENKAGLLYLDNRFERVLKPGVYAFWAARAPRVEQLDLRRQTLEVNGQEILTKDKVTIRVNIVAEYRVTDPVLAASRVKNATEHLYRLLQLAVRQTLGKRTLDEVLAEKVDVDAQAADAVRAEMAAIGIETGLIALKDIVLPGEIREILNQVVAAEKQAQANLIRRREETAATRSLLNTARLMDENPLLIRLKELETLERLTEKVGNLTVLGGFEGLLPRLLTPSAK